MQTKPAAGRYYYHLENKVVTMNAHEIKRAEEVEASDRRIIANVRLPEALRQETARELERWLRAVGCWPHGFLPTSFDPLAD